MKIRNVVAGLWLVAGVLAVAGCGSDDKMLKWSCNCDFSACAKSEDDAKSANTNASCGVSLNCEPTGDTCSCPGGADKCEIVIP